VYDVLAPARTPSIRGGTSLTNPQTFLAVKRRYLFSTAPNRPADFDQFMKVEIAKRINSTDN